MERCSDCGEAFVFSVGLDEHRERCTDSPGDVVDGSYGDGSCPMCGTDYGEKGVPQASRRLRRGRGRRGLDDSDGAGADGGRPARHRPAELGLIRSP